MYQVKLEKFSGPLDLLLQLIEKEKLDICDISIAHITSQFLDYLKQIQKTEPVYLADFLIIAATLILIKTKALLPYLNLTEEEEESVEDLKIKLFNYRKLKEIVEALKIIAKNKNISFSQEYCWETKISFYPPINLSLKDIYLVAARLISEYPFEEKLEKRQIKKTILLEQKIKDLRLRIEKSLKLDLSSLIKDKNSRLEIILVFLAILQLIKENFIIAEQKHLFSEIRIEKI